MTRRLASLLGLLSLALSAQTPPRFEVDATWPKPLPEDWVFGRLGGVCIDSHDHVALVDRRDITDEEAETSHNQSLPGHRDLSLRPRYLDWRQGSLVNLVPVVFVRALGKPQRLLLYLDVLVKAYKVGVQPGDTRDPYRSPVGGKRSRRPFHSAWRCE